MGVETKPWDSAELIHSESDLAGYLAAVLDETEFPKLYSHAIGVAERARGGRNAVAHETGISEQELRMAWEAKDMRALPVLTRVQQAYERLARTQLVA